MLRLRITVGLAAAVAVTSAGCSSGSSHHSAAGVQEVTIHSTNDFRFTASTVKVHVGSVHVTLVDDGAYPHNLAIAALHQTSSTVSGDPGGSMTSFTVHFARAGTYAFVCTYHSSAGMTGQFDVR